MKFNLKRLRAERVAKGLTQAQMASAIGISTNAYWHKENGQRDIGVNEFVKILQVLGYSKDKLSIFFDQSDDKREQKGER